jgi:hypothetical protein
VWQCVDTFFGTSLVYDEAKEMANRSEPMLKRSGPIGQWGAAADEVELMLIDYVSKMLYRVWVLYKSFCFKKFIFFLVKLYDIVIDKG